MAGGKTEVLTTEEKTALFREDIEWLLPKLPSDQRPAKGQKKITYDGAGRPTVMTQEVVLKLKAAFLNRCTNEEACQSARIGKNTFYVFLKKYPDFRDLVEAWRDDLVRIARRNVRKAVIEGGYAAAMDLLRVARKDEFAQKTILAPGKEVTADDLDAAARGDIEIIDADSEETEE